MTRSGNPGTGPVAVPIVDGALHCSSPWWVDYNHAPPGQPTFPGVRVEGSYLHLLAGLQCKDGPDGSSRPDLLEATLSQTELEKTAASSGAQTAYSVKCDLR